MNNYKTITDITTKTKVYSIPFILFGLAGCLALYLSGNIGFLFFIIPMISIAVLILIFGKGSYEIYFNDESETLIAKNKWKQIEFNLTDIYSCTADNVFGGNIAGAEGGTRYFIRLTGPNENKIKFVILNTENETKTNFDNLYYKIKLLRHNRAKEFSKRTKRFANNGSLCNNPVYIPKNN